MADNGNTNSYPVEGDTVDLSRQLEERLNEQLINDNIGDIVEGAGQTEAGAEPEPENIQSVQPAQEALEEEKPAVILQKEKKKRKEK